MCKNDKKECATAFTKNKDQLILNIKEIIEEIKNGEEFASILMKYSVKLLMNDDIGTKCNIIYILRVIIKFKSADGIRDIGETTMLMSYINKSKLFLQVKLQKLNYMLLDEF